VNATVDMGAGASRVQVGVGAQVWRRQWKRLRGFWHQVLSKRVRIRCKMSARGWFKVCEKRKREGEREREERERESKIIKCSQNELGYVEKGLDSRCVKRKREREGERERKRKRTRERARERERWGKQLLRPYQWPCALARPSRTSILLLSLNPFGWLSLPPPPHVQVHVYTYLLSY